MPRSVRPRHLAPEGLGWSTYALPQGTIGPVTGSTTDAVFEALISSFSTSASSSLIEIRRSGDEAVLMFRWPRHPHLFGVPVPLNETHRRMDWDHPADGLDDWIESVDLWLMEDVENGFVFRARRKRVDDYIELRGPDWASDERFYVDVTRRKDREDWLRVPFVVESGLDAQVAVHRREQKTLISWVTAYENNASGHPYVGHATVVRASNGVATLDFVETAVGTPLTLELDIVRAATHSAGQSGFPLVATDPDVLQPEILEIAGFRTSEDGLLAVDTSFLDEDADAADGLLARELQDPGLWGRDRDVAGRYLPRSRPGRLWHRLRHGTSGASPRLYAG